MADSSDIRKPLLSTQNYDDTDQTSLSSQNGTPVNYSSINGTGPQLRYTPLLGNCAHGVASRDSTPTNELGDVAKTSWGDDSEYKVYGVRWYVLIMFSLVCMTQGAVWNTFGPISTTSEDAFGWSDATIAFLSNWGPISYLVSGVFFSWAMDVRGLRFSCLITAFLIAVGTALRCITMDAPYVTWLMHAGQALNGLAGPVAMAGPPAVSAVWFPPEQRTTATAIGTLFGMLGSAVGFIMGPLLVPDVPNTNSTAFANVTNGTNSSRLFFWDHFSQLPLGYNVTHDDVMKHFDDRTGSNDLQMLFSLAETDAERISKEKKAIAFFMYLQAGWSAALFVVILAYFPRKPPIPPCASATIQREDFFRGIKQLFHADKVHFWIVALVYSVPVGVYNCWSGVLNVILKPHGIGESEAGWIGFYSVCGGAGASLCVGLLYFWYASVFIKIMKWMTLVFYFISTAAFVIFTLAANNFLPHIIPPSTVVFYTTIIVGTAALNAAIPLLFELSCELSYPTGEGTTNGVTTILCNFWGLVFLLIFFIPNIGSAWTNYTLVASVVVCLPLLVVLKERYNRYNIDQHHPHLNAEIIVEPPVQS